MTFEEKLPPRGSPRQRSVASRAVTQPSVSREVCADFVRSVKLEWLEANGTGGFAMGTVAGVSTRRYHGLLVGSLNPPVDLFVFLSKVEEVLHVHGRDHELATTQYPGIVRPAGYLSLESFRVDPFPIWTYVVHGAIVEKRLFIAHGKQTVILQYRANRECRLPVRPFLAYRYFHSLARENEQIDTHERRSSDAALMRMSPYAGLPTLTIHHGGSASNDNGCWYRSTEYLRELERGLEFREDLYCMGSIDFALAPDRPAWIVATIEKNGEWGFVRVASEDAVQRERRRTTEEEPFIARLSSAANAFRVRRDDGTPTIIAGYPWFADWGRDTMISLPGLLIARGLLDEARDVLTGFLDHVDKGLIPNRFADHGGPPEYNTADATLWMFYAAQEYLRAGGNRRWARDVFYPRAKDIISWHQGGTPHGIRIDPSDGLLIAGDRGAQLTWMDAKLGDWVITPRHGKAVEINALWFNALGFLQELAEEFGDTKLMGSTAAASERVLVGFARAFWNSSKGCLYDVVLPTGPDARVRPNQIFAASLPFSPLTLQKKSVVRVVENELVTPYGLRTRARGQPDYRPRYAGDPVSRDSACHQGTIWPWLLGPFVTANLNAFGRTSERRAVARSLLGSLEAHLDDACLGQISEVLDADEPHSPGGAPAQAWSVAEILRVPKTELAVP